MPKLSVIVPVYNERGTIQKTLERVRNEPYVLEIIAIDDGSLDGSISILEKAQRMPGTPLKIARHSDNRGKGAAIRTGVGIAQGEVTLIQDADLEYDPADYSRLVAPFADPLVMAVYGSRNIQPNPRSNWRFYWGGRLLSCITNLLYGSRITDEATGYKAVRTHLLRELDLKEDGFGFCPELTAKLLRRGINIHEVPISYRPRSRAEGKKIRMRHGIAAIWTLVRERFSRS